MSNKNSNLYHDQVVIHLIQFAVIWAVLAMVAGVYISAELVWPTIDFGQFWLSFGRLRPLHTNGIIFGFGVSALMATAFYSVQRTSHVPLFAPKLAWFCCFSWQLIVLLGGLSLLATRRVDLSERICRTRMAIRYCYRHRLGLLRRCILRHHRES